MNVTAKCALPGCTNNIKQSFIGRRKRFCSRKCQQGAFRGRTKTAYGKRNTPSESPLTLDTGVGVSSQNSLDNSTPCNGENSSNQIHRLFWLEVNSVTHKLTDGKMSRTPTSFGQWGGYETERGLAWAINTGWPFGKAAWYARCANKSYGPTDLETAKRAGMAFAKGAESFPELGMARTFTGPVNLHANPEVDAELRNREAKIEIQTKETETQ